MKKILIIYWLFLLMPFLTLGQSVDLKWTKQIAGPSGTYVPNKSYLALDNSGNTYQAGNFEGSTSFGNGASLSTSGRDMFILKRNTNGDISWVKHISSTNGYMECNAIHRDQANNIIVSGYFVSGSFTFAPGVTVAPVTNNINTAFIAKYDSNGNFAWVKTVSSSGSAMGYGVVSDNSGNVYTVGNFYQNAVFVPGRSGVRIVTTAEAFDTYIAKYDVNGNFVWAKKIGGTSNTTSTNLAIDNTQNIYITGSFAGTINFESGITLNSTGGAFYAKYDTNGGTIWAKKIDAAGQTYGIEVDNSNNIYLAGNFINSTLTIGSTTLSNKGLTDIFFGKFNSDGNPIWAKSIGGTHHESIANLKLDAFGGIYLGGAFESQVNFGKTILTAPVLGTVMPGGTVTYPNPSPDGFFAKYDSNGNEEFAKQIGNSGNNVDVINTLAVDNLGNILVGGFFAGACKFNETSTLTVTDGNSDMFIAKYWQAPEINVKRGGFNIPSGNNSYDFGNTLVTGSSVPLTLTIENLGGSPLDIAIASSSPEFIVNYNVSSINPYSSATFTVVFKPTSKGEKNEQILITNNDPNESPYSINVQGRGITPEINVKQGTTDIPNNTTFNVPNATVSLVNTTSFTIQNTGTATLTITSIEFVGTDASSFEASITPNSIVYFNNSISFNVLFKPSRMGLHTAQMRIRNTDLDKNPYIINLTGTGLTPDINIKQGTTNIPSGGTFTMPATPIGSPTAPVTFTLENLGNAALNVNYIHSSGGEGFIYVSGSFNGLTPVGEQKTLTLQFIPPIFSSGTKSITYYLYSNDYDESIYSFTISATVIEPEINVREGATNILHQTELNMGTLIENSLGGYSPTQKTLTIENLGLGYLYLPLSSPHVTITPIAGAGAFTVTQPNQNILAPNANTSIVVTFSPGANTYALTCQAVLEIKSNDSDESSYRIILTGTIQPLPLLNPNQLNIYPNPSPDGIFNADYTSNVSEIIQVEILNQQLQIVQYATFSKDVGTYSFSMNISNQPSGNYTMRLTSSQGRMGKLIIKQ